MFLDLNAYFASVEQQERPELRDRPVAVVPVEADTTFVIAASYEAKRFGVATGTRVSEAKRLCPEIELVKGRPPLYVHYHEAVLLAVDDVLPVDKVHSIDEMSFRLLGEERSPARAREIAIRLKSVIREKVGKHLRCSIGVAPNRFLAKVGTEMQKPDGLVILQERDLPHALFGLKLTDFPGINRRMKARLNAAGIFSSQDLCSAGPDKMRAAFGSIVGKRWYHLLRGEHAELEETARKTLSHSHVMAPELRTEAGARQVLIRLLQKAAARLRANGLAASAMEVSASGRRSWRAATRFDAANDTPTLTERLLGLWSESTVPDPVKVGVVFYDLVPAENLTPSLFGRGPQLTDLSRAIDDVNKRFGKNTVFLAAMEDAREAAPERIAFDKTWLFQEGKGDNEWESRAEPDTA